jgi:hypothetical protein
VTITEAPSAQTQYSFTIIASNMKPPATKQSPATPIRNCGYYWIVRAVSLHFDFAEKSIFFTD